MEIYSFGEDLNAGVLIDAALDEGGNIYVLSYSYEEKRSVLTLCNFRGDPVREIKLTNFPPKFEGIAPNRLIYRNGTLYLVSDSFMRVVITDPNGVYKDGIDLFAVMDIKSVVTRGGEKKEVEGTNSAFRLLREPRGTCSSHHQCRSGLCCLSGS
jgi:hypothetical protein